VIRAAGGVVVRARTGAGTDAGTDAGTGRSDTVEVLVVHRVAHDDWSLPKGHVDPGEDEAAAAVREVLEETGVRARIVAPLPPTEHPTPAGRKRVAWFLMAPLEGDPRTRPADTEVDVAAFVAAEELPTLLTYPGDAALVRIAIDDVVTTERGPR
jgi:8-oxo-(d)GTP phosphatase